MSDLTHFTLTGDRVHGDLSDLCYVFNARTGWHPADPTRTDINSYAITEVYSTPELARGAYRDRILSKIDDMLKVKRLDTPECRVVESVLLVAKRHLEFPGIPGWPSDERVQLVFEAPVCMTIETGIRPYRPRGAAKLGVGTHPFLTNEQAQLLRKVKCNG